MSKKYESIEMNLNDFSEETLQRLVLYSVEREITIEQAINRMIIIHLIKSGTNFEVSKVECTRCGKEFYGDIFSQCFKCNNEVSDPDFCTQEICDMYDNCMPMWMLVDDDNNLLCPNAPEVTYDDYILYISEYGMRYPNQRYGQILFNALMDIAPDIAEEIRSTVIDPFHTNSENTIVRFFNKVEELMGE